MISQRPILLGIVGDSAAGKTTITSGLMNILGAGCVTHVCTDDYHKFDRKERAALGITPLHPDCNYIDVLEQHIQRLYYGQPILKPVYDHATGSLVRPEYVTPRQFVIVEGLLGFCTPTLRQFYDVKVYLNPPEEMRKSWKMKRDTTKRGYTPEQVLAELERREPDSRNFIRPQREYADIVVKFHPPAGAALENAGGNLNVRLVLRPTIPHPDLGYLVKGNGGADSGVRLLLGRDEGRPADFLEIDGDVAAKHATELEDAIWQHLPDLRPVSEDQFGAYQDRREERHSPPLALTQLLIAYHLLREFNDVSQTGRKSVGPEWPLLGRKVAGLV
ncbi:MAG TPA: phosphoribulokinase [Bacillota bacterium]|nr:phosphoribulokinase [Bacillota bacterium]